jgi:hypothetical protein
MKDEYLERNKKVWQTEYSIRGKYMIFPKSQFSSLGGYSATEIGPLRNALIGIKGCN